MSTKSVPPQSTKDKIKQMLHDPENPLAGVFNTIEQKAKVPREFVFIGKNYQVVVYCLHCM